MPDLRDRWPALDPAQLAPTIEHLHRLSQIAGKYTLDQQFEPGWGNVVYGVTPRGLSTPTLRKAGVTFAVHYRLLDSDVVIDASTGTRTVRLTPRTVAGFYDEFVAAAAQLGLPAPGSSLACEIPNAPALDVDHEERPWDPAAAKLAWAALDGVAGGLEAWQASYRGHRPRVGVMWGGFDLSATRYRAAAADPPPDRPVFMQHGMSEQYVAVGFSFGSPEAPQPSLYAYIAPQPDGLDACDWAVDGAAWLPEAGLVVLPWEAVRGRPDPQATIVAFADAVYDAAVATGGWPPELVGPRFDGWHASRVAPDRSPTKEAA